MVITLLMKWVVVGGGEGRRGKERRRGREREKNHGMA